MLCPLSNRRPCSRGHPKLDPALPLPTLHTVSLSAAASKRLFEGTSSATENRVQKQLGVGLDAILETEQRMAKIADVAAACVPCT